MKKLNFKDIKNAMSRNEMRNVKGGCGSGYCYRDADCSYGSRCCKMGNYYFCTSGQC